VRRLGPLAAVVALLALAGASALVVVAVAVVGGALGVVSGVDAHRSLGVRLDDDVLVVRRGSLWRRTSVAVRAKVQSARTRSSPLQRRVALATAHADLAGAWTTTVAVDQPADRCLALVAALTGSAPVDGAGDPTGDPLAPLGSVRLDRAGPHEEDASWPTHLHPER
jgi:uncharacterized membrane protein YdbT with pleckstrin-like domain